MKKNNGILINMKMELKELTIFESSTYKPYNLTCEYTTNNIVNPRKASIYSIRFSISLYFTYPPMKAQRNYKRTFSVLPVAWQPFLAKCSGLFV